MSAPRRPVGSPTRSAASADSRTSPRSGPRSSTASPTTRYTGTLPASPGQPALLGFSDEELVEIGTDWQGAVVEVTVWIDAKGRVIGIERTLDLPAAAAGPCPPSR